MEKTGKNKNKSKSPYALAGTQAERIDEMLFKGATLEQLVATLALKKGRILTRIRALKARGKPITNSNGLYKLTK